MAGSHWLPPFGPKRAHRRLRHGHRYRGVSNSQEFFERSLDLIPRDVTDLGVGLFIVRRAIEVLGHRVDVSSVASRGSRFSIFAARTD